MRKAMACLMLFVFLLTSCQAQVLFILRHRGTSEVDECLRLQEPLMMSNMEQARFHGRAAGFDIEECRGMQGSSLYLTPAYPQ